MSVTIKLRRGNSSEWSSNSSIVLASGEPGYEIDTGRFKIGDGSTAWSGLYYASVIPTGLLSGSGINIDLGTNGSAATISVTGLDSSFISDFNEAVDDRIGSGLFSAGTGIDLSYDDNSNSFTVSVTGLINNPANNRILTSRDSTTTGIDSESNLTFDGSLLDVSGNVSANTGVFDSITVTDTGLVNNLNSDLLDNQEGSYYLDWTYTTNKPDPIITGVLTGDVAGTGSVTLADLQNGTLTINATIQPDSVALGTDTTGDYVSEITVSGTGLSVTGSGEDATYNIVSNATPANVANTIISRDSGGSFIANSGTFNQIVFNTGLVDPDLLAGQLQWNSTEGTLDLGLNDSYAMHLGEEMLYRVRNITGSTLLAGQPVYASGLSPGGNNRIEVNLYAADGSIREIRFMGLITEDLPDAGNNGYATQFGYIRGIDTRGDAATYGTTNKLWSTGEPAWNEGDILYVHPTVPGKLTKIEPKHSISVAIVTNKASNGKIFVRPTSYGHLDDNHDINVSGVTDGQFLQYNSATDYWVPSSSGNFSTLLVNGTGVSLSGHTHTASQITDFNEAVDDRIGSGLFVAGTGINLNYNDSGNSFTVSVSGLINNPTNNRILTSRDSSTTGIDAETNATFDGNTLAVSGALTVDNLRLDGNTLSATNTDGNIIVQTSGTGALQRDIGGDARGQYAVDLQNVRSANTQVAAGNYGVVGGGRNNTASGTYSFVGGGYQSKATRYGEVSHAAGSFANAGDAQHTILIARRTTTDSTPNQVLFLDGSSQRLTIPNNTTWVFEVKLSAYSDTEHEAGWWIFRGGIINREGGDVELLGSVISESFSEMQGMSASVVADDTNDALEIRVTGENGKNIRWVAVVDISQVNYGTP